MRPIHNACPPKSASSAHGTTHLLCSTRLCRWRCRRRPRRRSQLCCRRRRCSRVNRTPSKPHLVNGTTTTSRAHDTITPCPQERPRVTQYRPLLLRFWTGVRVTHPGRTTPHYRTRIRREKYNLRPTTKPGTRFSVPATQQISTVQPFPPTQITSASAGPCPSTQGLLV